MRIGFRVLALASVAAFAACISDDPNTNNPLIPDPTTVRLRVVNSTNTAIDIAGGDGTFIPLNSNIGFSVSRCFNSEAPGTLPHIRNHATLADIPIPGTVAATTGANAYLAGKSYVLVLWNDNVAQTTFNYVGWIGEGLYTPPTFDSAGVRYVNLAPAIGAIDAYVNDAITPAPALTATNRVALNVPVGAFSSFAAIYGSRNYQQRTTKTGVTASTQTDATQAGVQRGEATTQIFAQPSTTGTVGRTFSVAGC